MFPKYVKFFLRFSRPILVLVILGTVAFVFLAARIRFRFSLESLFESKAPELAQYKEFAERFGGDDHLLLIAVKAPDIFQPAELRVLRDLSNRLEALEGEGRPAVRRALSVHSAVEFAERLSREHNLRELFDPALLKRDLTTSPLTQNFLVSEDGRTGAVVVEIDAALRRDERRVARLLAEIRSLLAAQRAESGLEFHLAGIPVVEDEYVVLIQRDLLTFLPIAMGVFVLLLALYFRNVTGTLLPLAIVVAAIFWTVGWMSLFGVTIGLLTSVFPTLILVIGISDTVHILSRYEETLAVHPVKRDAIAYTLVHMAMACLMTTATSALGFASLILTDVTVVREFGIVTAFGILLSYAATLAILPAALDNAPPPRPRPRDAGPGDRSLGGIASLAIRFPKLLLLLAGAIVAVSLWGVSRIQIRSSWLQDLKPDHPVHRAHEFVERNLSSAFSADFEIHAPDGLQDTEVLEAIEALERRIQETWGPRIRFQNSVAGLIREANAFRERERAAAPLLFLGNRAAARSALEKFDLAAARRIPPAAEIPKVVAYLESRIGGDDLVRRTVDPSWTRTRLTVRMAMTSLELERFVEDVLEFHEANTKGRFELVPTGKSWMAKQALDRVMRDMAGSVLLVAFAFFGMFAILFKSAKVGLLSIVPNLVPLVVTAGVMGWAEIDLNFSTVTVFSISLGLAVDNTIHLLSRFRVEMAKDQDPEAATRRTLLGAGRPMVFSSLLLIVGFAAILTSNFKATFYFGLLGGATILSALFADLLLVPAMLLVFKPRVARWEAFANHLERLDAAVERFVRSGPEKRDK
jgi:hydrophobe/amphiphile efflux-3 (HAE3) family protein